MADTKPGSSAAKRKSPTTPKTPSTAKPRASAAKKGAAKETPTMTDTLTPTTTTPATGNRTEAKSRFNAALEEAKAGAAALRDEGKQRAAAYRDQAKGKGDDWVAEAKTYAADAKVKGKQLATDGKGKASEGLRSLGQLVSDNAQVVDEKLGAKYGDYARSASTTLSGYADTLDQKSVDDIAEDAREFVRKSPGTALGLAAIAGFFLSRLFRGSK